jgi:hypothetical protein
MRQDVKMKLNFKAPAGKTKIDNDELATWLILGVIVMVGAFCLYGSKTLLAKAAYQQKIISASSKASKQLDKNLVAANALSSQYKGLFDNNSPTNAIGANNDKSPNAVPPNVDNTRLAIDAMPVTYDYPALIASLTKILTDSGLSAPSITGTDQTASTSSTPSDKPTPTTITLNIAGSGNANAIQNVLTTLEKSIRPFDVTNVQVSSGSGKLSFTATVNTYFQPAKTLGISEGKVK